MISHSITDSLWYEATYISVDGSFLGMREYGVVMARSYLKVLETYEAVIPKESPQETLVKNTEVLKDFITWLEEQADLSIHESTKTYEAHLKETTKQT